MEQGYQRMGHRTRDEAMVIDKEEDKGLRIGNHFLSPP